MTRTSKKTTRKEIVDIALSASGWFPILPYESRALYIDETSNQARESTSSTNKRVLPGFHVAGSVKKDT